MTKLAKELTLYGLIMVAIGSCIGSGIFVTPSRIAGLLPSSALILLVWALGGIIALTGALTGVLFSCLQEDEPILIKLKGTARTTEKYSPRSRISSSPSS